MSTQPTTTPSRHNSVSALLVGLILASILVLALLIPSVKAAVSREAPPVTAVDLTIAPVTSEQRAQCPELTEDRLNRATTAVLATFVSYQPGVATYSARHWFRGGPADLVRIRAATPSDLESAMEGQAIGRGQVLIASRSGQVLTCGETAPYSAGQAAKYYSVFEQAQPTK